MLIGDQNIKISCVMRISRGNFVKNTENNLMIVYLLLQRIEMAINFLEALISEWLEYKGMFVRNNVFVGPREKVGYECELDVVAIDLNEKKTLQ